MCVFAWVVWVVGGHFYWVEEKLKADPPYSPLPLFLVPPYPLCSPGPFMRHPPSTPVVCSILDIERIGVPPPPKVDAYLKARVDKMYAQLAVSAAWLGWAGRGWAGLGWAGYTCNLASCSPCHCLVQSM